MSLAFRLSVAANVVLLALAGVFLLREPAPNETPSPLPQTAAVGIHPAEKQSREIFASPPPRPREEDTRAHPQLTPAAIARFEQAGLSREFLVEVVLQEFNRRWEARLADLPRRYAPSPVPEREYVELARLRAAEQVKELTAALGEAGYRAWDKEETLRRFNPSALPLTPDEAERVYRLQQHLDETLRELQMATEDGVADPADAEKLQAQAQTAFDRDIENLLGAERSRELRGIDESRNAAHPLFSEIDLSREQSAIITQAEANFRAGEIALTERLNRNAADAATIAAELQALEHAREEQFRQALGADAYEQLKRERDPMFQTLQRYAAAWKLDDREIPLVFETLRAFHEETERTRTAAQWGETAGHSGDGSAIENSIKQTRQRAEDSLRKLLGEERTRRLRQNGLLTPR